MLALALPVGVLIGVCLGALGGGGSILTVPALVYLLGQSPHSATTGSLLIVGITALAGTAGHWRARHVRLSEGMTFGLLGVAGSLVGSHLSAHTNPDALLTAFAALMMVAAVAMVRRGGPRPAVAEPHGEHRTTEATHAGRAGDADRPRPLPVAVDTRVALACPGSARMQCVRRSARVVAAATAVGLLTGFFGVGGGFVIVPALVLVLGFDMPTAVGTSLLVISINSVAALGARLGSHAKLDWPLLAIVTVAAVAGSLIGSKVAHRVDPRRLTHAFAALLIVVAGYVAARAVPGLL